MLKRNPSERDLEVAFLLMLALIVWDFSSVHQPEQR
jgi:hypothetical protein